MNHPEIPEELKGIEKKALNVVFATGPEGERYEIPLEVARQHPAQSEHPALVSPKDIPEEDEVEGHDAVRLIDGSVGYHSDWLTGPYIWHCDGCSYYGLHRHPFGWTNPLAVDTDDI